jgi:hypothetical protein
MARSWALDLRQMYVEVNMDTDYIFFDPVWQLPEDRIFRSLSSDLVGEQQQDFKHSSTFIEVEALTDAHESLRKAMWNNWKK